MSEKEYPNARDCEHGWLRRSCPHCEANEDMKVIEQLQEENDALVARVARLEAEHEDLVLRNALLRQRPDLPVERLQAYSQIQAEAVEPAIRTALRNLGNADLNEEDIIKFARGYANKIRQQGKDHENKASDILYSYIDRLKDPDPTHDPLDKIVSELIEAFEAAHHD